MTSSTRETGKIQNVLLVGASGGLGAPTLQHLDKAGFDVTILSRPDSSSSFPSKFKVIRADYQDEAALVQASTGQDAVVFLLGPLQGGLQPTFLDAAAEAGVKRFILGEFGFDSLNDTAVQINPIMGGKQAVWKHAKTLEDRGLTWTSIINGSFFDWSVKNNFNDINAKDRTAVLYDAGESEATVNTTTLDQAARAIVSVLQKPEETKNRHVYVSSFAITGSQLLKAYEDILGGEKFKVTHASTEELEKNAKERLGKGDQTAVYDLIKVNIWRRGAGCDYGASKELDNELLGLPKEDLHAVLAEALGV